MLYQRYFPTNTGENSSCKFILTPYEDIFDNKRNYKTNLPSSSFNATSSSLLKVIPLLIFLPSGDQSRMSYLGSRSFQLIRLICFSHPFSDLDRTPIFSIMSNLISDIYTSYSTIAISSSVKP